MASATSPSPGPTKVPKVRGAWNNLWDVEGFLFRRFPSSYAVNSATFRCRVTSSLKCASLCGADTNAFPTFLRNSSCSFNDFFIIHSSLSAFLISVLLVNENKFKLESTRPENACFERSRRKFVLKNLFAWRKIGGNTVHSGLHQQLCCLNIFILIGSQQASGILCRNFFRSERNRNRNDKI